MSNRALIAMLVGLALAGCKDTAAPPDPSAFNAFEERPRSDPGVISFHNLSVEMAALEIFAPRVKPKDCQAEAPHRLLCPRDYRHILDKRVYPRKKVMVDYPKELGLDCAQVWVRVQSKVMGKDEFREAIFLLGNRDHGLRLQLGEGEAARLEQKDIEAKNQFPAPARFCPRGDGEMAEVPSGARSEQETAQVLKAAGDRLDACCKDTPCRGVLKATLTLDRNGTVRRIDSVGSQGKVPEECLSKVLSGLEFSGFTPKLTTASISLRLPRGR